MVKKFSRAYILGSGFSKSFSEKVPTIKDLTDRLFELKSEEYQTLTSFVNRLFESSNELEEFRNIENIATLFFSKRIYKDFEEELYYEKLRFELIKFIFHEIQNRRVEEGKISTLSKFIDHAIDDSQSDPAALITFNYDLLIEEILRLKNKNNPLKIVIDYGLEFDTYGHKKFEAGINFLYV